MNNEEDVKEKGSETKGGLILPTINNKRNQFFDLDEFNSDEKDPEKADGNNNVNPEGMNSASK